jgi:hypothetical protein
MAIESTVASGSLDVVQVRSIPKRFIQQRARRSETTPVSAPDGARFVSSWQQGSGRIRAGWLVPTSYPVQPQGIVHGMALRSWASMRAVQKHIDMA